MIFSSLSSDKARWRNRTAWMMTMQSIRSFSDGIKSPKSVHLCVLSRKDEQSSFILKMWQKDLNVTKREDIFNMAWCMTLGDFLFLMLLTQKRDAIHRGVEHTWTARYGFFRFRRKRSLTFVVYKVRSTILLEALHFSRSMGTSICPALFAHIVPLCLWTKMNETTSCISDDSDIEQAVLWDLEFDINGWIGKKKSVCFLNRLPGDSSNKMPDTGELQLTYFKNGMFELSSAQTSSPFMTERHHHIVVLLAWKSLWSHIKVRKISPLAKCKVC